MTSNDRKQIPLPVIDVQYDFVHEDGSLYIGNSPDEMAKIADAIMRLQADDAKHASEQAPIIIADSGVDAGSRLLRELRSEHYSLLMVELPSPTIRSTLADLLRQIQDDLNGKPGGVMTHLAIERNIAGFGNNGSSGPGLAEQADLLVSIEAMSHCVRSEPPRRHRKIPHPPTKLKVGKQGRR